MKAKTTPKTKPTQPPPEPEKFSIVINGTDNKDVLFATRGDDTVYGGAHRDLLFGQSNLGGADGHDKLYGGAGNDTLIGGPGDDLLDGGDGIDAAVFSSDVLMWMPGKGVAVDLTIAGPQNTRVGFKTFVSIENLLGTSKSDSLKGNAEANNLFGDAGNDTLLGRGGDDVLDGYTGNDHLNGGDGDDTLIGGVGKDKLTGGAGEDTFSLSLKTKERGKFDTITDFKLGEDKIGLIGPALNGFKENGSLAAKAFHIGSQARDADTRILYDKNSGKLYFDADGTGAQAALQIAKLAKGLALTNTDFVV